MKRNFKLQQAIIPVVVVAVVWIVAISRPAYAAAPWYVSLGGNDNNDCLSPITACATINGAIGKANSGDTINVASGTYTDTSGSEVMLVHKSLIFSGGWNGTFTVQSGTTIIDGEKIHRGITVNGGVTASLDHFVIQNGYHAVNDNTPGGLYNQGTLTVSNSIVRGNNSFNEIGGVVNAGYLIVHDSSIVNNVGGIYNVGFGKLILNDTFIGNNNSAGFVGGINNFFGIVVLNNSTVSRNSCGFNGGGIFNYYGGTVELNNSTVSENTAGLNGAGIANNVGMITMKNTIVTGNTLWYSGDPSDCGGNIYSGGYNLVGNTSNCNFIQSTGDLTNTTAHLGLLLGIPESPKYYPLLVGSPAIDAGDPTGCLGGTGELTPTIPLTTDQRGVSRVGRCDIGAYEYITPSQATLVYAFDGTPQRAPILSTFSLPLQVAVLDSVGTPVSNTVVTFSAPASGPSGIFTGTNTYSITAITAESGIATSAPLKANGSIGTFTVTATVTEVITATSFLLENFAQIYLPTVFRNQP